MYALAWVWIIGTVCKCLIHCLRDSEHEKESSVMLRPVHWLTGWDSGGFGDRLGYWQPLVSFEFSVKRCWHQNTYALHMYRCSTSKHNSLAINRSDVNAALGQSSSSPMALKVTSSSGTQARNDQKTQRFFGDVVGKWWYSPGNLRLCYWKKHAHSLDLPFFLEVIFHGTLSVYEMKLTPGPSLARHLPGFLWVSQYGYWDWAWPEPSEPSEPMKKRSQRSFLNTSRLERSLSQGGRIQKIIPFLILGHRFDTADLPVRGSNHFFFFRRGPSFCTSCFLKEVEAVSPLVDICILEITVVFIESRYDRYNYSWQ